MDDPMYLISFLLTVDGVGIDCSFINKVMTTDIAAATSRTGRI